MIQAATKPIKLRRSDVLWGLWFVQLANGIMGLILNVMLITQGEWDGSALFTPIAIYAGVLTLIYIIERLGIKRESAGTDV